MGEVCQLPLPGWPRAAASVSPGRSSVLRLLRFLKCHLCLMAALISCIREKHTPVVSGYICSQGSVPTHAHCVGVIRHRRVPWQSAGAAVQTIRKGGKKEKKISGSPQKIKTANGLIISPRSRSARAASRRVLTRRLYRGKLI